jgi:2-polyprenyl-3-methyl-5-hydroxy-6-metoxy-1,4-benzoquinol methylase
MSTEKDLEVAADWDALWETEPEDEDFDVEETTLRWRVQMEHIRTRFGSMEGLKVVEIGAGRATNALMYARHGAEVTILDQSALALDLAQQRFARFGLTATSVEADVFDLPAELLDAFDVSMSFGLCEHFLGPRRLAVVKAHLDVVRPGGLALVNVPNKFSPFYRAWMGIAKRRGTWTLGTEVPFSAREMKELGTLSGGQPLKPVHCGGLGTLINQGPNTVLRRLGRRPLPVPQTQIPGVDLLAYDLMAPIVKPA